MVPGKTLTENAVRAANPPETGTSTIWDGSLKNFGVRISHGGAKTFIVLIGSGRRQSLGRYPHLKLADARAAAKRILAEKALGKVRPLGKAFDDAKAEFLAYCDVHNKPRTKSDYERLLNRHFPFGRRSVGDIRTQDVHQKLKAINAPSERHHAFLAARRFFNWCESERYTDRSPVDKITPPPPSKKRKRVLTDHELKAVWVAAGEAGKFGNIVRLLILTGQRRSEIANLEEGWIIGYAITLPDWLTKNKMEHVFPIWEETTAIIKQVLGSNAEPRGSSLLFPAVGKPNKPFNGWAKSKRALDKAAGVAGWRLHDLRRTFRTQLAALGVSKHVAEKLINHISGEDAGVSGVYNRHEYWSEQVAAMQAWEAKLVSLVRG